MGRKCQIVYSWNESTWNCKRNRKKQKWYIHRINAKFSWNAEYEEGLEYGQKVDVYIKKIDYERKKLNC